MRSNLSAKPAASNPDAPALKAYADTTNPNCRVVMCRSPSISAPSGLMIMKSRMIVNCRNARIATTNF